MYTIVSVLKVVQDQASTPLHHGKWKEKKT